MSLVLWLGRKLLLDKAGIQYSLLQQMNLLSIPQVLFYLDNWNCQAGWSEQIQYNFNLPVFNILGAQSVQVQICLIVLSAGPQSQCSVWRPHNWVQLQTLCLVLTCCYRCSLTYKIMLIYVHSVSNYMYLRLYMTVCKFTCYTCWLKCHIQDVF